MCVQSFILGAAVAVIGMAAGWIIAITGMLLPMLINLSK